MKILTALIKTEYFVDKLRSNLSDLKSYVIDYADCSSLILEQIGEYRYRKLRYCILGQEDPMGVIETISKYDSSTFFYCNKLSHIIDPEEVDRVRNHPANYAVVLYDCFQ